MTCNERLLDSISIEELEAEIELTEGTERTAWLFLLMIKRMKEL